MGKLGDKLREAAAEADALEGGGTSSPVQTYPMIVVRSDVNILAKEPLAETYLPTGNMWVFGHGEHFVGEPSNAPDGYARRSASGFPLFYPLGGDGKPTGEPRVMFADSTWDSDAQVLEFIAREPARWAAMVERDRAAAALVHPGPIPASIYPDDAATMLALYGASLIPGCASIGYQLVNGTRADLGRILSYTDTHRGEFNAFDLASYAGPYKAVIDAYVAAHQT